MAKQLSIEDAEFIAHAVASELMNYVDEPMPPFNTRTPNILESCLGEPFQTFGGQYLHPTLSSKAAILFYLVIKNHPFANGNKRMAVVLTGVFYIVNNQVLDVSPKALYEIACHVAKSEPKDKETVVSALTDTFKEHVRPLSVLERLGK